ncbi:ABC transporter permease [Ascidiaceihabitans sp.]|uniref:ABC transporter permease n=1 Tax=Ascidiaceihabitans sp. TaxID=1872644 RepID=UPI0032984F42
MNSSRPVNVMLGLYVALVFAFVFVPIIFSMIFSFNSQRFPTIPLGDFSTEWYEKIFADPDVWEAALNSLIVSTSTALIATFLGFCTAYSDFRYNFRFKGPYLALILLPPTIPLIIMALAMLAWFSKIGMSGQLYSIVIAHSVLTAPFAMAVIRLRLNQMDPDLEAAAWNLGGSEWQTMRHVIIPFCKPAIASALFLTAAVSFDEFAVSWFVSGLNKTLPVVVLEIVQGNIDPQVNAIGTFVFLISMTLVVLAQVFFAGRQLKSIRP